MSLFHASKIITPGKFTHKFYYYVFILIELYFSNFIYFTNFRPLTSFSVMIPETAWYNFALLTMSTCARNM